MEGRRVWQGRATLRSTRGSLADGSRAVVLFNRGKDDKEITATWEDIGYPAHLAASVRDLWQHKDLGKLQLSKFTATVALARRRDGQGETVVRPFVRGARSAEPGRQLPGEYRLFSGQRIPCQCLTEQVTLGVFRADTFR
jgi:hypothetical protein